MHVNKHLAFSALRRTLSERFRKVSDNRQESKVDHSMHDCLMSGFSMMLLQDPSVLCFQKRLQQQHHQNNLTTIFDVDTIPKESQMRDTLDGIDTDPIDAVFPDYLKRLQRHKQLIHYQVLGGYCLIALDGSGYFSSYKIKCPHCLRQKKKGLPVRYHHSVLQAAIMNPDMRQVLPMAPEFIRNNDGNKKQDCEINAGKRLLGKIRTAHPKLKIIINADGLYSKQPFIDEVKAAGMSFILVAKPNDHTVLFEWVEDMMSLDAGHFLEFVDTKKRRHLYQWVNQVPLNGTKDADDVNFLQYQIIARDGKIVYKNSWVTDIRIDSENIVELVKAARCRWKIENETFNTLKNQGYHLEHNFGHGKQNLCEVFFRLNMLAFFVHQILELTDRLYQNVRAKFSSRKEFWNQIRCTMRVLIFRNWQHLFEFLHAPPEIEPP